MAEMEWVVSMGLSSGGKWGLCWGWRNRVEKIWGRFMGLRRGVNIGLRRCVIIIDLVVWWGRICGI